MRLGGLQIEPLMGVSPSCDNSNLLLDFDFDPRFSRYRTQSSEKNTPSTVECLGLLTIRPLRILDEYRGPH